MFSNNEYKDLVLKFKEIIKKLRRPILIKEDLKDLIKQ